ncbi:MAG TPA: alpha/beta hydrolase [Longimicrobium sp.]|nr:alpha/beta hydrolase [Longimicrobium sp.]
MSAALPPPAGVSSQFLSGDGLSLHAIAWAAERPRAAVFLSHGLGEHAGRYAGLARDFVRRGISLYALDHRGHGRSGGPRAFVQRFDRFVADLEDFRRRVVRDAPGLPLFLYGHSLGGLIALRWLQTHADVPLAGAVLSAPLLGVKVQAPRWKLALAAPLSKLLPALPMKNEIDPAELTHDEAHVRAYREDPLVSNRVTPRLFTEMTAAMARANEEGARVRVPLLFLVPGADSIVQEEATLRFAANLRGDVTVRRYPGFRHEPHNEVERDRPVGDVLEWMDRQIAAAG